VDAGMLHGGTYAFANDNCIETYPSLYSIPIDMEVSAVKDEQVFGTPSELLAMVTARETAADSFLSSPPRFAALPLCMGERGVLPVVNASVDVTDTLAALSPVPCSHKSTATSRRTCVPGLHKTMHDAMCILPHAPSGAHAKDVSRCTEHGALDVADEAAGNCTHLPSLMDDYRIRSTGDSELVSEILSGEASRCDTSPRSQSSSVLTTETRRNWRGDCNDVAGSRHPAVPLGALVDSSQHRGQAPLPSIAASAAADDGVFLSYRYRKTRGDDGLVYSEKEMQRRHKNRESAKRSRVARAGKLDLLELELATVKASNVLLLAQNAVLTSENLALKTRGI